MLHTVQEDGFFTWQCAGKNCMHLLGSHITDTAVEWRVSAATGGGAVIVLPLCPACGAQQTFLKADYSVQEVWGYLRWFTDQGRQRGCAMELRYARSFRLLTMLYDAGKLPIRPLLPMLPYAMIKQSALCGLPYDVVDSFFLPYALFGRCINYDGIDGHIVALAAKAGIKPLVPQAEVKRLR